MGLLFVYVRGNLVPDECQKVYCTCSPHARVAGIAGLLLFVSRTESKFCLQSPHLPPPSTVHGPAFAGPTLLECPPVALPLLASSPRQLTSHKPKPPAAIRLHCPYRPLPPPLPSAGHPPSTGSAHHLSGRHPPLIHPTLPTTLTSPNPRWRRDNSNVSSCNHRNHHPLPYPHNHLKRTATITCHR